MNAKKESQGHMHFDTSSARPIVIKEVPGYRLRKPIEVELFDGRDDLQGMLVMAYTLPTGERIYGIGKSEEEVQRDLAYTFSNFAHFYLREKFDHPEARKIEQHFKDLVTATASGEAVPVC